MLGDCLEPVFQAMCLFFSSTVFPNFVSTGRVEADPVRLRIAQFALLRIVANWSDDLCGATRSSKKGVPFMRQCSEAF